MASLINVRTEKIKHRGGPKCRMLMLKGRYQECITNLYFPQCHMSNLRTDCVTCHYIFSPHVTCRMSNLRNTHVALTILFLGVSGQRAQATHTPRKLIRLLRWPKSTNMCFSPAHCCAPHRNAELPTKTAELPTKLLSTQPKLLSSRPNCCLAKLLCF